MAILNMHDVVINLDDSGGTPRDISGSSNKVDMSSDIALGSYFVFGSRHSKNGYGGVKTTGTLSVLEAPDTNYAHQILRDIAMSTTTPTDRTLTVDTPNSSTGGIRYTGEAKFSKIDLTSKEAGKGDPPVCAAAFEYNGAPSVSVLA